MNHDVNDPRGAWMRLTAAARQGDEAPGTAAPYGFATRVAAIALAQEARVVSVLERFAFRAVGVASLLALFSVVLNYEVLSPAPAAQVATTAAFDESELMPTDDAVAIVLDLAD